MIKDKQDPGLKMMGRSVAVLGLGISGFQSALFLKEKGFDLWCSDLGDSEDLRERVNRLRERGIEAECGKHSKDRILQADWVLISPGIPPTSDIYRSLKSKNIPVVSEIEVASWYSSTSRIIAVTGTSGKTTVTTLIDRVLKKKGFHSVLCGNIGNPWIGELSHIKKDDFVALETSSFQLEHCRTFRPHIAALLNISPNHEDWHKDLAEYAASKLKIFQNQTSEDYALFREKDRAMFFPEFEFKGKILNFGGDTAQNPNEEVVRLVARLLGCQRHDVDEVLADFEGIEHRLEKFLTAGGVTFINDSKSTTASSLAWALEKFDDGKVILLAGGHPKSRDFHQVAGLIGRKVKQAVLIGEATPQLRQAWAGACPLNEAVDFRHAVQTACRQAVAGDVVLLSPACASFDMFKNYMERGRLFKELICEIAGPAQSCAVQSATQS